jgi:hypothetical protein
MKKFFFILATIATLASCTPIETEVQLMPIDYLTAGNIKKWKLTLFKNAEVDQLTECIKDDTFTFSKKDGKYGWNKGENKCYSEDVDTSFDFKLSPDGSSITINEYVYKVNKLDVQNFEIEIVLNGHRQILGYSKAE